MDSSTLQPDVLYVKAASAISKALGVSVRLSVCLSARIAYLRNHVAELHQILLLCDWPSLGPPLLALQYSMYFRFSG